MEFQIIYDWPGETRISIDIEEGHVEAYISQSETDQSEAVRRCMECIKSRGVGLCQWKK